MGPVFIFFISAVVLLFVDGCSSTNRTIPSEFLDSKNINTFIEDQKKKIHENEKNSEAHFLLSKGYLLNNQLELAERHARMATRLDPLNGGYYEQLGNTVFKLKRYSEALIELGTAIEIDPERISAYLTLARTYEKIGDTSRAVAVLEETLNRDRYYIEALFFLGRLHIRQHEYDNAIQVLDELIRIEPENREALLLRIQAYSSHGSYYYARSLVEEMISKWPDYRPLHYELLRILFSQHEWVEAGSMLESFFKEEDLNAELYLIQAYLKLNSGDSKSANLSFLKVLELEPLNVDALLGLGALSIREGDLDQSLEFLNRAVEVNSRLGRVHFLRATVLFRQGDYLQGDLALKRAIEIDPQEPTFLLLSLRRSLMQGKWSLVDKSLRSLEEKYPLKIEVLQLRAGLASAKGDLQSARKLLEQARITYHSPLLDFSLARVFYLQKKYNSVLKLTESLLLKLPVSWEVVYLHSLSLAQLERWDEALQISQTYIKRPESKGFAHRLVGDIYRYQGNEKKAQKTYRLGLEEDPDHIFLIEALSASWMISGNWKENHELLQNALENNDRLKGQISMRLVLLDRLALTLHQLKKDEQMKKVIQEFHKLNDPVHKTRMFSMDEQLLFPHDITTVSTDWLFIPEPVTSRLNGNQ